MEKTAFAHVENGSYSDAIEFYRKALSSNAVDARRHLKLRGGLMIAYLLAGPTNDVPEGARAEFGCIAAEANLRWIDGAEAT